MDSSRAASNIPTIRFMFLRGFFWIMSLNHQSNLYNPSMLIKVPT